MLNGDGHCPASRRSRQFFGRTMSTAFLAFSETWVTPAGGPLMPLPETPVTPGIGRLDR